MKKEKIRRVNITIPESIYEEIVNKRKWKLSSTIRESLEDSLSEEKIIFSVTKETKEIYHSIFNNCDCTDKDLEPYLRSALSAYVDDVIKNKIGMLSEIKDQLVN